MLSLLYTSDLFTMILYILHPIKLNITVNNNLINVSSGSVNILRLDTYINKSNTVC